MFFYSPILLDRLINPKNVNNPTISVAVMYNSFFVAVK